jgi:hypothetical protein
MCVSQTNGINFPGRDGKLAIFINICALLHTAIDKDELSAGVKKRTRACYLMGGTQKCQFHEYNTSIVHDMGSLSIYSISYFVHFVKKT